MERTSSELSARRTHAVLAVVALALMAVVSAVSGLNVALPSLARDTGATQTELTWIVDAYTVVFAGLLLLRYAEYEGELYRLFSVLKMRFSDFDRALHVYRIEAGSGIRIAGPAPRAEGLLTGQARPLGVPATPPATRTGAGAEPL